MTSRASPASVAGGGEDSQRLWGGRGSSTDVVTVREPLGCCSVGTPPVAPWQSQPYRGREALSLVGMCSCSMGWPVLQRGGLWFWLDNIWGCLQLVTHLHTLAIVITLWHFHLSVKWKHGRNVLTEHLIMLFKCFGYVSFFVCIIWND